MPTTLCNMNCSTERFFNANKNWSIDADLDVIFDLEYPDTPAETRRLRIIDIHTGDELLNVSLNENGGLKPKNTKDMYRPTHKPLLHQDDEPCDTLQERVFYADINLTDDDDVTVIFKIKLGPDDRDVIRTLTVFGSTNVVPAKLNNREIELGDGKKPLEGGVRSKARQEEVADKAGKA